MDAQVQHARDMVDGIDGVTTATRQGGTVINIATSAGHAAVALQGAQLLSWQPSGQSHDVMWQSPLTRFGGGEAIRGGIPICWPWFSKHADAAKPQHGFARNVLWRLTAAERIGDNVRLDFQLPADCLGREHLDGSAELSFRVTISHTLDMALTTKNVGATPFTVTQALHTYFHVGDVGRIDIAGLDGATYRDNTDGGREKRLTGALMIARETVALFDEAPPVQTLTDPVLARRIVVTRTGGTSTVVWNPGAAASTMGDIPARAQNQFVCIESGAIGRAATTLSPGGSVMIGAHYEVKKT